jgi:hypothetical protein
MSENDRLKTELDYASGWFQYTASQRLTTFNFFLVVVGLLLVGYAQAISHDWRLFGACIGFIGAIISLGFLIIDIRNEVLVNKGLLALKQLEKGMRISLADPALDGAHLKNVLDESFIGRPIARHIYKDPKSPKHERLFKYRFWLRAVITVVGLGFLLGSIWAGFGF